MGTLVLVLAACLAGPSLVVGLAAVGVPWQITSALVASSAAVVVWRTAQQARAVGYQRLHWPAVIAVVTVLGAATVYTARLSYFMLDETRADLSVLPNRAFFRAHSCLSSYTEAARLAPSGVNIFDPAQYSDPARPGQNAARFIGPFEVDLYQYPPAFLALPRPPVAAGLDFLTIRKLWFAVQSIVLFATMVLLARWIGGSSGLLVLLLVPVVWLSPTTRLPLQIGNFQLTAFALTVLAMLAFDGGHVRGGGFALGFAAVSKVYPGMLGVLLIARRQWRAVGWTVASSAAFTAAAWLMVGSAPFVDFFRYQWPRIASGQAFFWMEAADVAPINFGVHGLVIKLRFLGLPWTGHEAASRAASLYAVLLLPLAAISAWRLRQLGSAIGGPRAFPPPAGAGVARPAQPRVVSKPVRSRRLRALRHALAPHTRRGRRSLAGGRTDRARRRRRDCHDGPRRRGSTRPGPGVDHGCHTLRPACGHRLQRRDRAHARACAAGPHRPNERTSRRPYHDGHDDTMSTMNLFGSAHREHRAIVVIVNAP